MARNTTVTYTDDLTGNTLTADQVTTVTFRWKGHNRVIETDAEGAAALTKTLDGIAAKGRSTRSAKKNTGEGATIRAWAKDNGYTVGVRGRLKSDIVQEYHKKNA